MHLNMDVTAIVLKHRPSQRIRGHVFGCLHVIQQTVIAVSGMGFDLRHVRHMLKVMHTAVPGHKPLIHICILDHSAMIIMGTIVLHIRDNPPSYFQQEQVALAVGH